MKFKVGDLVRVDIPESTEDLFIKAVYREDRCWYTVGDMRGGSGTPFADSELITPEEWEHKYGEAEA